ncbi:MAG: phosphatase PAP2 family protein [Lachnospiraceae bacterium]|nr:phosphatase PAP2 family protein [Lachnospiraceae bacterium]
MVEFLGIFETDRDILLYVQDHIRNGFLDKIFPNITHLGDAGIFWILLTVALLCFKKTRRAGLFSAAALAGSVLVNNVILKNAIGRTRPYELIDELVLIGKKASDASFPSGHTAASVASCTAILPNVKKRWWAPLILMAVLIALSRVYIGIHYPSDIVGGLISGVVLGILANVIGSLVLRKWFPELEDKWFPKNMETVPADAVLSVGSPVTDPVPSDAFQEGK